MPKSEIEQQIKWLKYRDIRQSKAGYLVSACLGRFDDPERLKIKRNHVGLDQSNKESVDVKRSKELQYFRERKETLVAVWQEQQSTDRERWQRRAIQNASDVKVKACIQFDSPTCGCPHEFVLDAMAVDLGLAPTSERALRPEASAINTDLRSGGLEQLKKEGSSAGID